MKRIFLLVAILCSLSVTAQRIYRIEGVPQRFVNALALPINPASYYNNTSDSAIIFFDRLDTNTISFKYKGLVKKLGTSRMTWDSILNIPANFTTTYALSNDVKDSIQKRLSVTITSPALGNLIRYNGSQWVNWAPTFLNVADSFFTTGYTTRATTKYIIDSLGAVKNNISDTAAMLWPYVRGTGSNNTIPKFNSTTRRLLNSSITDNGTFVSTGTTARLGVGTTTDDGSTRLQVNGSASFSGIINANSSLYLNAGNTLRIYNPAGTNWARIFGTATSGAGLADVHIVGGSGNGIFVSQAGNLGVGNTSPANKVDVAGSITTSGTGFNATTAAELKITNTTETTGRSYVLNSLNAGALQIADLTAGGVTRFLINSTGESIFSNGITSKRGRISSLVINKDSVPITTSNAWVLTVDTTGTPYTNRVNRRNINDFYVGDASFDTTARTLTIPKAGGGSTVLVIPRGTASGTSGITALSSSRTGNLVTVSGDNGSSTIFSVRDADSSAALQSLTAGNGLSGSPYNGGSPLTWTVDTSVISTKANVTGLLTGYATTSSLSAYKLASDSFFSNGYTTRARLKQYGDSLSNATNFIYPESYGAVADGATNSRTALQAAVDASASLKKTLVLSGRYYTDSTITIPEGASIMGNGTGTTNSIYTTSNTPIFNINGSNVLIRGISFLGSGRVGPAYTTNNQHGIRVYGSADLLTNKKRIHISDCSFYDLAGAGIYVAQNVGDFFEGGVQVSNSYAFSCGVGFFTDIRGEYNSFSNNYAYACWVGWRNAGGNNRWIGGQLTSNYTGAYFEGGANNGHGKLVGAALNHNTEYAVWSNGVTIGMDIDNCNIYVNDIYIQDSRGIKFNGNDFSVNNIYFENSTDIEFVNNKYTTTPVFDTTFNGTTSTYRFFNEYFWATTPSIIKNTLKQQLIVEGSIKGTKIIGNSATPSVSLGTGITGSVSVTGTDLAGTVTVTVTGASSLATLNELFTITYSSAYSSIPNVVWSPASANAAALLQAAGGLYLKNSGTSSFQIATVNSYTTPGSATYSFTYHVIQ